MVSNKQTDLTMQLKQDELFMQEALREAEQAAVDDEVPVGAVLVANNQIVVRAHNLRETLGDPTAHAEILALRQAAQIRKHWRLADLTLYCTLEPCPMCAGAMVQARIARLVYGAGDPKAGAAGSLMNIVQDQRLNHRLEVTGGVLAAASEEILKQFFRSRR